MKWRIRYDTMYEVWFSEPFNTYAEALATCMKEHEQYHRGEITRFTVNCYVVEYDEKAAANGDTDKG